MSAPAFRFAGRADAPAIAALIESAYRGEESRRGWTNEAHLLEGDRTSVAEIESLIAASNAAFLMASVNGDFVGCALVKHDGKGAGYFGMFAVSPGRQGGGLGSAIIERAERHAGETWSCTEMEMTVISLREELIAYYERRGYVRTGTKPFPFDSEPGAKRKDFHFVVLTKALP